MVGLVRYHQFILLLHMPELAEVEYYRKQWNPGIGQTVERVEMNAKKRIFREVDLVALQQGLIGAVLVGSETKGKQMCFRFKGHHYLGIHLGMTGKLRAEPIKLLNKDKHDHLVLYLTQQITLVFNDPRMFGLVRYGQQSGGPSWWVDLPPEVLSDIFTFERMDRFLDRRSKSSLKSVLLMQEMFPGVGNWMADEILYKCRINPHRQSASLSSKERDSLFETVKHVSSEALRVIGINWGELPDSWLFNHRWKDGGVCPETGCKLLREKIGGRTTCWSPSWQG